MPEHRFTTKSGREVTVQLKTLLLRTPGKPMPRDFTCVVSAHKGVAYLELGAAHTKANEFEIKRAIGEVLKTLGFTRVEYEHNGKEHGFDL